MNDIDIIEAELAHLLGDAASPSLEEAENAFQNAKAVLNLAGWPASLSAIFVSADKAFQADKSSGQWTAEKIKRHYDAFTKLEGLAREALKNVDTPGTPPGKGKGKGKKSAAPVPSPEALAAPAPAAEESFFDKSIAGPVTVRHVGIGLAGLVGLVGVGLLIRGATK
jgi:hypothetical protein